MLQFILLIYSAYISYIIFVLFIHYKQNIDTEFLEEIFVVQDEVFYHDVRIGYLNSSKQLEDFDEEDFDQEPSLEDLADIDFE